MPVVTGTPVSVKQTGFDVEVVISLGNKSKTLVIKCDDDVDAAHCHDMWEGLVYNAIDYQENAESDYQDEDWDEGDDQAENLKIV